MSLPPALHRSLARLRRQLCESVGVSRYSRPALFDIDRKLERHLDFDGGCFIEAGANDGLQQSNTYYFEKLRGWTGLLVEAIPSLVDECRKNRLGPVIQAALVEREEPGATVEIQWAGLMSTVTGALGDADATSRHVEAGLAVQGLSGNQRLRVPARSLSGLIDQAGLNRPIDLLSLDVEGGELAALRGIDFDRHAPRHICVEARNESELRALLEPRYNLLEVLTDMGTHRDLLYRLR